MQQQPEPVVGEVVVAVPDRLDLLDQPVDGFGGPAGDSAGVEVGQQLEATDLGHRLRDWGATWQQLDAAAGISQQDERGGRVKGVLPAGNSSGPC